MTTTYLSDATNEARKIDLKTLEAVEADGGVRLVSSRGAETELMRLMGAANFWDYYSHKNLIVGEKPEKAVLKVKDVAFR